MKSVPELDPELRGLLEEIAADPRSRLRLAPRDALRSWYLGGETVRPRELDATAAERHLVAAHREALAALFCEASRLAYWKGAALAHRPRGRSGDVRDLASAEAALRGVVEVRLRRGASELTALHSCMDAGLAPPDGASLARASMALVPTAPARLALASHLMQCGAEAATELFLHVARFSFSGEEKALARASLGAMQFELGQLDQARTAYQQARECWPEANLSLMNLALLAEQDGEFVCAAVAFHAGVLRKSGAGAETFALLRRWCSGHPALTRQLHPRFLRLKDRVPEAVQALASAYDLSST